MDSPSHFIMERISHAQNDFDSTGIDKFFLTELEIASDWMISRAPRQDLRLVEENAFVALCTQQFLASFLLARAGLYSPAFSALRVATEHASRCHLVLARKPSSDEPIWSSDEINEKEAWATRRSAEDDGRKDANIWYAIGTEAFFGFLSEDIHISIPTLTSARLPGHVKSRSALGKVVSITDEQGRPGDVHFRVFGGHQVPDPSCQPGAFYVQWHRCLSRLMVAFSVNPDFSSVRNAVGDRFPLAQVISCPVDVEELARIMWEKPREKGSQLAVTAHVLDVESGKIVRPHDPKYNLDKADLSTAIPICELDPILAVRRILPNESNHTLLIPEFDGSNLIRLMFERLEPNRKDSAKWRDFQKRNAVDWKLADPEIHREAVTLAKEWCQAWRLEIR